MVFGRTVLPLTPRKLDGGIDLDMQSKEYLNMVFRMYVIRNAQHATRNKGP